MKKVINFAGKGAYESPCCEILSVQAEGVLCLSPGDPYGETGAAGSIGSVISQGGGEDY